MYGSYNFDFVENPVGVKTITPARYPGQHGKFAWAPRGVAIETLDAPPINRLASESVMNVEYDGPPMPGPVSNEQQLDFLAPGEQDLWAHIGVASNRYLGKTRPSSIYMKTPDVATEPFTQSLYATPTDSQQNLISAGVMTNPYTGESYECFENQLPPGNTDRSLTRTQLQNIQPRLLHLQGSYNTHNPPPRKIEHDGSVFKPVSARGGANPFGPQLYSKPISDRLTDIAIRSTYNNRNGDQVVEPAIARERPANFFGLQPRIRFNPYVVPTNELVGGTYTPPVETQGVDTRQREEFTGAMFSTKQRALMKNHPWLAEGPSAPNAMMESQHIDPQREGMIGPSPGPGSNVGFRTQTEYIPRPTQMISALPVGMVTATVLPPTRVIDNRSTSNGLLSTLPTAAITGASGPTAKGIHAQSLRTVINPLPTATVSGVVGPAVKGVHAQSLRTVVDPLPIATVTGAVGQIVKGEHNQTLRTVVAPLPVGGTETATGGTVFSNTTRDGPQGVGVLPTSLPVGQLAPATVPTTMTFLADRPGALPGALPTGANAQLVNLTVNVRPTQRLEDPTPIPSGAYDIGSNVGATSKIRGIMNRVRDFGAMRVSNPGTSGGEVPTAENRTVLAFRGTDTNAYKFGEFVDLPEGPGGGTRPVNPDNVRGRSLDMDMTFPPTTDPGMPVARPPDPTLRDDNEREQLNMNRLRAVLNDV